jgi:hypothetical protein
MAGFIPERRQFNQQRFSFDVWMTKKVLCHLPGTKVPGRLLFLIKEQAGVIRIQQADSGPASNIGTFSFKSTDSSLAPALANFHA